MRIVLSHGRSCSPCFPSLGWIAPVTPLVFLSSLVECCRLLLQKSIPLLLCILDEHIDGMSSPWIDQEESVRMEGMASMRRSGQILFEPRLWLLGRP